MDPATEAKVPKEIAPPHSSSCPFDGPFFQTILPDRIQAACPGSSGAIPVVLLQLADGRTLDLCHIDLLTPHWMAVEAFRDTVSCEEMDVVFVPYEMIALVTLSRRSPAQRRVGFRLEKPPSTGLAQPSSEPEKEVHRCQTFARA